MFRYVDDHFHTPESFIETTTPLADNADVRERLFDGFRTEIIALAEGRDLDAEPEPEAEADPDQEADPDDEEGGETDDETQVDAEDDGPITEAENERNQAIEDILLDVFESDLYRETFIAQLGSVQSQTIRAADLPDEALLRDPGQIVFDARGLYPRIYEDLAADPRTAEITQNVVPDSYGIYPVGDRETTVNGVWWFVENGPNWRGLAMALAVAAFIAMVVVAERRPSRVIQFGLGMVGLALVVVVVVYIVRAIVPLLASGSDHTGSVVAVYAANLSPLISIMWRIMIVGVGLAVVGGIAKLIWPDDWVYGHVSDDRGARSIRRRRSTPEAEPQQQVQQPVAAAVPVGYAPYGYPAPGWGAQPYGAPPYGGQPYGAQPYGAQPYGYPAGPYAQPMPQGIPPQAGAGRPTVPVQAIPQTAQPGSEVVTGEVPAVPTSNGSGDRPADAAQAVPRVVASAPEGARETEAAAPTPVVPPAEEKIVSVVDEPAVIESAASKAEAAAGDDDDWTSDGDW